MTNRQSNVIFYSIISMVVYALIINFFYPDFFVNILKSEKEVSLKEALNNKEYTQALSTYQQLIEERINDGEENSTETAAMYEDMANLYFILGNRSEEKKNYLKSLNIKEKLKKNDMFDFAKTYYKLGLIAEEDEQYDQAQTYYEQSLLKRLGDAQKKDERNQGMITGMHQTRLSYIRLNNEATIAVFKRLAEIHKVKNERVIAKKYYGKALAASQIVFGDEATETLAIIDLMKRLTLH